MSSETNHLESRLRGHVDIIAGVIGERNSTKPSALDATRAYIRKQCNDLGLQVVEHRYPIYGRDAINLEIVIPGITANQPSLVVGAHYDTAPSTPGADDNTSVVAALLEIIANLHNKKLARTLCCIFYDCEEPPHFGTKNMGSYRDAQARNLRDERIHGMICLESIGYFPRKVEPSLDRPRYIYWLDQLLGGRFVVIVSDLNSIGFGFPFLLRFLTSGIFRCIPAALPQSIGAIGLSDHGSYWHFGYRALMVTNTALFRNPNYHTPNDLPATLDYGRLTRLTRMLTTAIFRTCR